jgi:hypothetical protein
MRKAVIDTETGRVENIITIEGGTFNPGTGKELQEASNAKIGGTWDGTVYIDPPAPEPKSNPQAELDAAIAAATTWQELQTALLGVNGTAKVIGRQK